MQADSVVCTLPLAILQQGRVEFDPPLPVEKQTAIAQLGCGLLNKCVLTFPHVFWQDSDFLGVLSSSTVPPTTTTKSTATGTNSDSNVAAKKERHSHPDGNYLILNGACYTGQPVLIFMYGGDFAKAVEEWTDEEIVSDCLRVLDRIYASTIISRRIPQPLDYQVTRWGKEEYSGMAFTCMILSPNGDL